MGSIAPVVSSGRRCPGIAVTLSLRSMLSRAKTFSSCCGACAGYYRRRPRRCAHRFLAGHKAEIEGAGVPFGRRTGCPQNARGDQASGGCTGRPTLGSTMSWPIRSDYQHLIALVQPRPDWRRPATPPMELTLPLTSKWPGHRRSRGRRWRRVERSVSALPSTRPLDRYLEAVKILSSTKLTTPATASEPNRPRPTGNHVNPLHQLGGQHVDIHVEVGVDGTTRRPSSSTNVRFSKIRRFSSSCRHSHRQGARAVEGVKSQPAPAGC